MARPTTPGQRLEYLRKLEELGIDGICDGILNGESLTSMARELKIPVSALIKWCESDGARARQLREARVSAAKIWDEQAIEHIKAAPDRHNLSVAREVAHHLRWRAQMVSPKDYASRMIHEQVGSGGGPINVQATDLRGLSDEELATMQRLMLKAAAAQSGNS